MGHHQEHQDMENGNTIKGKCKTTEQRIFARKRRHTGRKTRKHMITSRYIERSDNSIQHSFTRNNKIGIKRTFSISKKATHFE